MNTIHVSTRCRRKKTDSRIDVCGCPSLSGIRTRLGRCLQIFLVNKPSLCRGNICRASHTLADDVPRPLPFLSGFRASVSFHAFLTIPSAERALPKLRQDYSRIYPSYAGAASCVLVLISVSIGSARLYNHRSFGGTRSRRKLLERERALDEAKLDQPLTNEPLISRNNGYTIRNWPCYL